MASTMQTQNSLCEGVSSQQNPSVSCDGTAPVVILLSSDCVRVSLRCHLYLPRYNANLPYVFTVDSKLFYMLEIPWAHLDIAGAAWDHKAHHATGFGAQTLAEWAISQGQYRMCKGPGVGCNIGAT